MTIILGTRVSAQVRDTGHKSTQIGTNQRLKAIGIGTDDTLIHSKKQGPTRSSPQEVNASKQKRQADVTARHDDSLHILLGTPSSRLTCDRLPQARLIPLGSCQLVASRKDLELSSHVPIPDPLHWSERVPSVPSQIQSRGSLSSSQAAQRRHYLQLSQPSTGR